MSFLKKTSARVSYFQYTFFNCQSRKSSTQWTGCTKDICPSNYLNHVIYSRFTTFQSHVVLLCMLIYGHGRCNTWSWDVPVFTCGFPAVTNYCCIYSIHYMMCLLTLDFFLTYVCFSSKYNIRCFVCNNCTWLVVLGHMVWKAAIIPFT